MVPLVPSMQGGQSGRVDELRGLLAEHRADAFPESLEKGFDYGAVAPVMLDADIFGWASTIAAGSRLSSVDQRRLRSARDSLELSLNALPEEARAYYVRLLEIADKALNADPCLPD